MHGKFPGENLTTREDGIITFARKKEEKFVKLPDTRVKKKRERGTLEILVKKWHVN